MKFLGIDDDGVGRDNRLPCFAADPQPYYPPFDSLINPTAIVPVNQYGALGFDEVRQNPAFPRTVPPWWTCPFMDFCDGPEIEGIPDLDPVYTFRWQVFLNLRSFLVFYRRAGEPYQQAPLALFPAPLPPTASNITLSFDANARPYFGYDDSAAGRVYLAFTVAGVPTFVDFDGACPRLFFNGQLQRDNTQTDVVCYYIRAGILRARFQRETFGVEYTIADVSATFGPLTRLTKTDRASTNFRAALHQVIFAWGTPATVEIELRSLAYPPFPVGMADHFSADILPPSGSYASGIVNGGTYADHFAAAVLAPSGAYTGVIVDGGSYSDSFAAQLVPPSGTYTQVVIDGGSHADSFAATGVPPSGTYTEVSVAGGSYADNFAAQILPPSGSYS